MEEKKEFLLFGKKYKLEGKKIYKWSPQRNRWVFYKIMSNFKNKKILIYPDLK